MTKIGLIVAMGKEFNQIKQLLSDSQQTQSNGFTFLCGHLGNNEIIALQCGIGKVCSALGAAELIRRFQPDYVVNSGVAGWTPGLKLWISSSAPTPFTTMSTAAAIANWARSRIFLCIIPAA